MENKNIKNFGYATQMIHGQLPADPNYGAIAAPIYQTSTYCYESVEACGAVFAGESDGFGYSRGGSDPTTKQLQEKLALLERGEACAITASGMGAIGATFIAFSEKGSHIIADNCLYGCSDFALRDTLTKFGVEVTFMDLKDTEALKENLRENTRLVFFETPTNPTMKVIDIEAVSKIVHDYSEDIRVVVDNTFAPPPMQYPLDLGADVIVHSLTKYINGHGDVIAGAVIGREEDVKKIAGQAATKICGSHLGAFESFLVLRGLYTLELRLQRHCSNGLALAKFLEGHEYIERIEYPGLTSHPDHELAKRQMHDMYGGVMSFEVKDGINGLSQFEAAKQIVNQLKIAKIAVSLGDPETLVQHPAGMTHAVIPEEERIKADITDGLIRVSAGLETEEDIINDFKQAFDSL